MKEYEGFVDASASAHGSDGYIHRAKRPRKLLTAARPVKIGLPGVWEREFGDYLDIVTKKYTKNLDHNSGDPIGISVCQNSALDGRRTTASGAFLSAVPANLTILTDTAVERVLCDGQKAVGVEIAGKNSRAPQPFCLQLLI